MADIRKTGLSLGSRPKLSLGRPVATPATGPGEKQAQGGIVKIPKGGTAIVRPKLRGRKTALEEGGEAEIKDLAADFQRKKKRENERRSLATDASFFITLVFSSTEDAATVRQFVDLDGIEECVDGYAFIEKIRGKGMPATPIQKPIVNVLDTWADRALAIAPPPPTMFDAEGYLSDDE